MRLRFPVAALGAAAAFVLAGCASPKASETPAPPQAYAEAADTSGPAPAQAAPRPSAGLDHEQLKAIVKDAKGPGLRAALAGKSVQLLLERAKGARGAPDYVVDADDRMVFRCHAGPARSHAGGETVARIRDARWEPKAKRMVIDLEGCAAPVGEAAADAASSVSLSSAATSGAVKSGMDARGNVVDSSKVESGSGRLVKGLNDYEGEITGRPARDSRFKGLQIGMSVRQVHAIAGAPTDQGAYMTGKAWIPFYYGADRHRFEMTYKGLGRLIFAGGGVGDFSEGHLIWIIHNANEPGYR